MTKTMNARIHALFGTIAEALNDQEISVGMFLTGCGGPMQVQWTPVLVKEIIWRPALVAAARKFSTKELNDEQAEKLMTAITDRIHELHEINIWDYEDNTNH